MKTATFVLYKSGRKEIIHHKSKPDMERSRKMLGALPSVQTFRTPTKQDMMEAR